jgi:hypothetical protein
MTYGIIFWGNSSFSTQIFRIQKRIITIMSGLRPRDSCRETFKDWGFLPLQSQYIFSLLTSVVNNMGFYHSTSQIHGFNKRHNFDLYCPQTNLSICQRGPYYFGIKLSHNAKQFRMALRTIARTLTIKIPHLILYSIVTILVQTTI